MTGVFLFSLSSLSTVGLVLFTFVLAVVGHIAVLLVRGVGNRYAKRLTERARPKWMSISSLGSSILIFVVYFAAFGKVMQEMGISVTAYIASASVVGLAVAFGSQRLVQDVLTGLTLVFSDLLDVGDMVEIGGQTGYVRSISMRFVILQNSMGAKVYIPNHTIVNVVNYPKGYVSCTVDVGLLPGDELQNEIRMEIKKIIKSYEDQFPGIIVGETSVRDRLKTSSGKELVRIKFRIWPGRGSVIEKGFKQELLKTLQAKNPSYDEWMIVIAYEVEKKNRKVKKASSANQ